MTYELRMNDGSDHPLAAQWRTVATFYAHTFNDALLKSHRVIVEHKNEAPNITLGFRLVRGASQQVVSEVFV